MKACIEELGAEYTRTGEEGEGNAYTKVSNLDPFWGDKSKSVKQKKKQRCEGENSH